MATNARTAAASAGSGATAPDKSRAHRSERETVQESPETAEEPGDLTPSVWLAFKELGTAAKGLVLALVRSVLRLWRVIHWLIRGLLIWLGIPVAVGIFGISVSYHLLGFYLATQAKTATQLKNQIVTLQNEQEALQEKLDSALSDLEKAKAEAVSKDEARKTSDAAVVAAKQMVAAQDGKTSLSNPRSTNKGPIALADKKSAKKISMPCDLDGPADSHGTQLSQCLKTYVKLTGG